MEAMPSKSADRARWDAVRTWPELRGEAKLAWQYLWGLANFRPQTIKVAPLSVAIDQGSRQNRTGAGLLRRLAAHGLIQIIASDESAWAVYVRDPLEVAKESLKRIESDGQGELFPDDQPSDPPSGVTDEPASLPIRQSSHGGAQHPARDRARDVATPIQIQGGRALVGVPDSRMHFELAKQHRARDVARQIRPGVRITSPEGAEPPDPPGVGQVAEEALDRLHARWMIPQAKKDQDAKELSGRILIEVGESVKECLRLAIATEVIAGTYPMTDLEGVFRSTKKYRDAGFNKYTGGKLLPGDVANYFVGAVISSMKIRGLDPRKKKPPPTTETNETPF